MNTFIRLSLAHDIFNHSLSGFLEINWINRTRRRSRVVRNCSARRSDWKWLLCAGRNLGTREPRQQSHHRPRTPAPSTAANLKRKRTYEHIIWRRRRNVIQPAAGDNVDHQGVPYRRVHCTHSSHKRESSWMIQWIYILGIFQALLGKMFHYLSDCLIKSIIVCEYIIWIFLAPPTDLLLFYS